MKKNVNRYWESEVPETVLFGNSFLRCYDKAGKLQLGVRECSKKTDEPYFAVKFVIDRKDLFDSDAASYLRSLFEDWEEVYVKECGDD